MVWYEIEKAQLLNDQYMRQIEKTQQAIVLLHSAYSNSGKEFEEVLRMQQQLLKYEMSTATTLKSYYVALAKLDYLSARELGSMTIGL
jgi:flagellar hook-associated protein FlgK